MTNITDSVLITYTIQENRTASCSLPIVSRRKSGSRTLFCFELSGLLPGKVSKGLVGFCHLVGVVLLSDCLSIIL